MTNKETKTITLQLTAIAAGGEALGRHEGQIIFVPLAAPGEEIRAEIVETHKNFSRARVVEILTPSSARIVPRCPHFGVCGGCQWQHLAYDTQVEYKTGIVREQFARIGKLPDAPIAPMIPARSEWQYRNHAQFALNGQGQLCYRAYGSHNLVPIRECPILAPPLVEMFNTLELEGADFDAVNLRAGINTNEKMIVFESSDPVPPAIEIDEPVSIAFQVRDVVVPLIGNDKIHETLRGRTYAYSPNAFFQVNTPMAEKLIELVREFLAPRGGETLLDAYSGVGLFGLSLANQVARVVMVEENPSALQDARANAGELTNVEFHAGRVEEVLPGLDRSFELAVLDPPREGCDKRVIESLVQVSPHTVVYVSCDPATLARDAARFIAAGYRLDLVQPVDLFPQTYHIECVTKFSRPD